MNSNFTITFLKDGEEQVKQIPFTEICWFECVSIGGARRQEIQGQEIQGQEIQGQEIQGQEIQGQEKQNQELHIVQFRDESAIYSLDGRLPLRYVRYADPMEKGLVNFERGTPITRLSLDTSIQQENTSLYETYLHSINFIQFAGTFSSYSYSNGFYSDRWSMASHTEKELRELLQSYETQLKEGECIACGEYRSSETRGYCSECWIELNRIC